MVGCPRDNDISGTLHPAALSNLTVLYDFVMSGNKLSGSLPSTLGMPPGTQSQDTSSYTKQPGGYAELEFRVTQDSCLRWRR